MRLTIDRPQGFLPAASFRGFEQPSTGSTIAVTEITASAYDMVTGMTEKALLGRGMELLNQEHNDADDIISRLYEVRQVVNEATFAKWIRVVGNERTAVLITATCAERLREDLGPALRDAVGSVQLDFSKETSRGPESPIAELKYAGRLGHLSIYTSTGQLPIENLPSPQFAAGWHVVSIPKQALSPFAKSLISLKDELVDIEIEFETDVSIDEIAGIEIIARGRSVRDDSTLRVYVCLLHTPDAVFMMRGSAGVDRFPHYGAVFARMARAFRRDAEEGRELASNAAGQTPSEGFPTI